MMSWPAFSRSDNEARVCSTQLLPVVRTAVVAGVAAEAQAVRSMQARRRRSLLACRLFSTRVWIAIQFVAVHGPTFIGAIRPGQSRHDAFGPEVDLVKSLVAAQIADAVTGQIKITLTLV